MEYAGKVYSRDIFVGCVCANNITTLKRKASILCNNYYSNIDTMILHKADGKEIGELKFTRINKLSPNNEVVRGEWQ